MGQIKKVMMVIPVILICGLLCFGNSKLVFAEGSRELTTDAVFDSEGNPTYTEDGREIRESQSNQAYRPFIEWMNQTTAGMSRKQIEQVYAKTGEVIYLGSDRFDIKNTDDCNIIVYQPDGNLYNGALMDGTPVKDGVIDLKKDSAGVIKDRKEELNGPQYTFGDKTYNKGGYTPVAIAVTSDCEGVWKFEFHGKSASLKTNPGLHKVSDDAWSDTTNKNWSVYQNSGCVAAWDITVVSPVENASGEQTGWKEKPGRMFTKCVFMNMGNFANGTALYATMYVLTNDGYIYETDFNGMDPYGFVFFGNNRGLISKATGDCLNHSFKSKATNLENLDNDSGYFYNPNSSDTETDRTYRVFYTQPSEDLPSAIKK